MERRFWLSLLLERFVVVVVVVVVVSVFIFDFPASAEIVVTAAAPALLRDIREAICRCLKSKELL